MYTDVGSEVLTAIIMKVASFWDIAPCNPYMKQRFGGTYLPSRLLARWFLTLLIFDPEDGSDTFLRNVCSYTDYTAPEDVNFQCIQTNYKLRGLSPRANYTDRATAACRRS
jgi:hypothetical protein